MTKPRTNSHERLDAIREREIRAKVKAHGGIFHGPHVEHLSMPETSFFAFMAEQDAALTAAEAENERLRLLQEFAKDLAWRSYLGILVLQTVLKKSKLEAGADVSAKLLADIAIQYPHFPAKSALRTTARTVAKVENGAFTASFKREKAKREMDK